MKQILITFIYAIVIFENTYGAPITKDKTKAVKLKGEINRTKVKPKEDNTKIKNYVGSAIKSLDDINCEKDSQRPVKAGKSSPFKTICNPVLNSCPEISDKQSSTSIILDKFTRIGGDPIALTQALCFLNKHKENRFRARPDTGYPRGMGITNQRYITINDLTKKSNKLRLFVIDLQEGTVKAYRSAHGRGSGRIKNPRTFHKHSSNKYNSGATPRGFFLTGNKYRRRPRNPRSWKIGMRLHGLQKGINDYSFDRGIVMHSTSYVRPYTLTSEELGDRNISELSDEEKEELLGKDLIYASGNTDGCTGVGSKEIFDEIYEKIGSGVIDLRMTESYTDDKGNIIKAYPDNHSLYYNYTKTERSKGKSYCGDDPKAELMLFKSKDKKP